MPWPISERLRDYLAVSYSLERVLGEGGMGCVILATERTLERRVAIKVLRADAAADAEYRERFRREARTAAKLSHPNIVPLYTFGEVEGEMFFVMAFVDGETLSARIKREAALDPAELRRIIGALAEALDYAHGFGIVHRDIKPENILLERQSGRPMLTDFGIAREHSAATSLTQTGVIVGTPHYMSPEQASGGREIDGRADLYSLGVVAYRAFAGRLPFGGESVQDVLRQHMIAEPAPAPAEQTEQDPGLADIITRALKKDPAERWATGRELADALRNTEADDVPESLVGVESVFARLAYFGAIGAAAFVLSPVTGLLERGEALLSAAAVLVMAGAAPLIVAAVARFKDNVSFRRVWTLGWRAPRSWKAWWPKRFRRPGDVWDRLPREARFFRNINAVANYGLVPLEAGGVLWALSPKGQEAFVAFIINASSGEKNLLIGGVVALSLGLVVSIAVSAQLLKRRVGATPAQLRMILSIPMTDARWQQDRLARLLEPASGAAIASTAGGATGELAPILALVRELARTDSLLPPALTDAVKSAVRARDELAAEMERLRGEVDPQAIEGLDKRLAALDAVSPHDADLRALLANQRELMARIERRLDDLGARRLRLAEQLRLLHEQLIELRARGAEQHEDITGRIRAMSSDLRRIGEAWSEMEGIAGRAPD